MLIGVDIRRKLTFVWLVLFLLMWIVFTVCFKTGTMRSQLEAVEQAVTNKDWPRAEKETEKFTTTYKARKHLIAINNSSEINITFNHTVEQLAIAVKNKQDSALEYTGLLKAAIGYAVQPFAEP